MHKPDREKPHRAYIMCHRCALPCGENGKINRGKAVNNTSAGKKNPKHTHIKIHRHASRRLEGFCKVCVWLPWQCDICITLLLMYWFSAKWRLYFLWIQRFPQFVLPSCEKMKFLLIKSYCLCLDGLDSKLDLSFSPRSCHFIWHKKPGVPNCSWAQELWLYKEV